MYGPLAVVVVVFTSWYSLRRWGHVHPPVHPLRRIFYMGLLVFLGYGFVGELREYLMGTDTLLTFFCGVFLFGYLAYVILRVPGPNDDDDDGDRERVKDWVRLVPAKGML